MPIVDRYEFMPRDWVYRVDPFLQRSLVSVGLLELNVEEEQSIVVRGAAMSSKKWDHQNNPFLRSYLGNI